MNQYRSIRNEPYINPKCGGLSDPKARWGYFLEAYYRQQTIAQIKRLFPLEQRNSDGFINATAMCKAHNKLIAEWFRNKETLDLFRALEAKLGIKSIYGNSHKIDLARVSASQYTKLFPTLVVSKLGQPEHGGGTWLHPDLAIQLAQWCNPLFAIQVSRWVRGWMTLLHAQIEQENKEQEKKLNLKQES